LACCAAFLPRPACLPTLLAYAPARTALGPVDRLVGQLDRFSTRFFQRLYFFLDYK
jgi:hypothetical protein